MGDPGEQVTPRSVPYRVSLPQEVAVGPVVSLSVLDGLVDCILQRALSVPVADCLPQPASPAAHRANVVYEHLQVATRQGHVIQKIEGSLTNFVGAVGCSHRQSEQARAGLGSSS